VRFFARHLCAVHQLVEVRNKLGVFHQLFSVGQSLSTGHTIPSGAECLKSGWFGHNGRAASSRRLLRRLSLLDRERLTNRFAGRTSSRRYAFCHFLAHPRFGDLADATMYALTKGKPIR
jgi:hypothetical protein